MPTYYQSKHGIVLENMSTIKGMVYKININYQYNTLDAILEYSNLSLLRLTTDTAASIANIKIQLPSKTEKFDLKNKAEVKYLGNNIYSISGKLKTPYTELLIDKGIVKDSRIINEKYEIARIKGIFGEEDDSMIKALLIISVITIIIFITTLSLTKKVKNYKNYVRNPEEVIEPILAEALIDRKIGAKELIMSCIVELIYRGNLKNIGNDKVQLINEENISKYEMEILGLFFKEKGQIITFDEINQIFIQDNEKTKELFSKFEIIKKKIEEKLFNYNIYSKVGEQILKILKLISIVTIAEVVYMLSGLFDTGTVYLITMMQIAFIVAIIAIGGIFFNINYAEDSFKSISRKLENYEIKISIITMAIIGVVSINDVFKEHLGIFIALLIVFGLNLIILIKTKLHVFTQAGKLEFKRAQGLKNYIVDYSLMKERDIESTIIWDEYLAYAVAFGIPNKITDKFNENLMNTNIVLQKIEKILKM